MSREVVFFDTKFLVYCNDLAAGRKAKIASSLVAEALLIRNGFISIQVLQEYFSALTKKLSVPADQAQRAVESAAELSVISLNPSAALNCRK
jgi:predicted nucleic acid-binding protein